MTRASSPAFARPASEYTASGTLSDGNDAVRESDGLTKREYFAAAALPGVLAADPEGHLTEDKAARYAVRHADALIRALNGEGEGA